MNYTIKLFILVFLGGFFTDSISFSKSAQIDQIINEQINSKKISGAVVLINHKGETIHHKAYGKQDIADNIRMDQSSMFRIYSMTKPVTTLAAMILVHRGEIALDDPIDKYLPELIDVKVLEKGKNVNPKRKISIRDLMRHTSGFAYGLGLGMSKVDMQYNLNHPLFSTSSNEMIDKLAKFPIKNHPGEKYSYSLSVDVLGALVERVSKKSLYDFMSENIFSPLGMNDTHFEIPSSKTNRFTTLYGLNLKTKDSYKESEYRNRPFHQGGGGLISTSSDYLKFCRLILSHGIHGTDTIISPALVDEMTKNQLPEGEGVFKLGGEVGIGFGLGFSVYLKEWGNKGHKGDFAWRGIGNTHFYCSPKEDLVVIIMTQKMPASQKLVTKLKPIIYDALKD